MRQHRGRVGDLVISARAIAPTTPAQRSTNHVWLRAQIKALRDDRRRAGAYGDRALTNEELARLLTSMLEGKESSPR